MFPSLTSVYKTDLYLSICFKNILNLITVLFHPLKTVRDGSQVSPVLHLLF